MKYFKILDFNEVSIIYLIKAFAFEALISEYQLSGICTFEGEEDQI